ncbi:MAG TPA: hypothetical protein DDY78_04565 [Planctomycetales bacterium]|jgi:hypothetical protein|nr:hypothetical protein [Planctomycetales bacterium]
MKTIETTGFVGTSGSLHLEVPTGLVSGTHRVVVIIDEAIEPEPERPPLNLPLLPAVAWPENFSLRREDMYDDWGR